MIEYPFKGHAFRGGRGGQHFQRFVSVKDFARIIMKSFLLCLD